MMAEDIFGPDVGSLKGKTTRRGTDHVAINLIDIPASIMNQYKSIILGGDIIFVNKIPFFVTMSRHIKFGTAEMLQNQQSKTILRAIKQVKSAYMKRGFKISNQSEVTWQKCKSISILFPMMNTSQRWKDTFIPSKSMHVVYIAYCRFGEFQQG